MILTVLVPSFVNYKHNKSPYKLVCDDLRPGNILVDRDLRITAICDWEWSYAAPYQQFCTAPRWLLLKSPEDWRFDEPYDGGPGHDDMLKAYTKKLDLFLKIMEEEEAKRAALKNGSSTSTSTCEPYIGKLQLSGTLTNNAAAAHDSLPKMIVQPCDRSPGTELQPEPLSSLMRKSLTNGHFWFNECLRAYDFDHMYWIRLDDLGYGSGRGTIEDKVKRWATAPANQHVEKFEADKCRDLAGYGQELKEFMKSINL